MRLFVGLWFGGRRGEEWGLGGALLWLWGRGVEEAGMEKTSNRAAMEGKRNVLFVYFHGYMYTYGNIYS